MALNSDGNVHGIAWVIETQSIELSGPNSVVLVYVQVGKDMRLLLATKVLFDEMSSCTDVWLESLREAEKFRRRLT
jgi:hypothetical protein